MWFVCFISSTKNKRRNSLSESYIFMQSKQYTVFISIYFGFFFSSFFLARIDLTENLIATQMWCSYCSIIFGLTFSSGFLNIYIWYGSFNGYWKGVCVCSYRCIEILRNYDYYCWHFYGIARESMKRLRIGKNENTNDTSSSILNLCFNVNNCIFFHVSN